MKNLPCPIKYRKKSVGCQKFCLSLNLIDNLWSMIKLRREHRKLSNLEDFN